MDRTSYICARLKGENSAPAEHAGGDSGGPLFLKRNGSVQQIGIVAFGPECGLNGIPDFTTPGFYTRTSSYIGFIKTYAKEGVDCSKK